MGETKNSQPSSPSTYEMTQERNAEGMLSGWHQLMAPFTFRCAQALAWREFSATNENWPQGVTHNLIESLQWKGCKRFTCANQASKAQFRSRGGFAQVGVDRQNATQEHLLVQVCPGLVCCQSNGEALKISQILIGRRTPEMEFTGWGRTEVGMMGSRGE